MGALGLNMAFVGRNIAANAPENSVGGWLLCIHNQLRPGVAAARSALVRAPAATALSRRTLPAPRAEHGVKQAHFGHLYTTRTTSTMAQRILSHAHSPPARGNVVCTP